MLDQFQNLVENLFYGRRIGCFIEFLVDFLFQFLAYLVGSLIHGLVCLVFQFLLNGSAQSVFF